MNIKQKKCPKKIILNTLSLSILFVHMSAHALQALDDGDLRAINGQDGIHIEASLKESNIKTLYWTDQSGRAESDATDQSLTAIANTVKLQKSNISSTPLTADMKLNMGTVDNKVATNLDLSLSPMLLTVESFQICDSAISGTRCSAKIGSLAVQTTSNTHFGLKTTNGILSKTDLAELNLGLQNANIYLGQVSASGQLNQLILKNFNFNFKGQGFIFVDPIEGFKLQTNSGTVNGYVDLTRVVDSASANLVNTGTYGGSSTTNAGLNLEIMLNKGVTSTNAYSLDSTNTPTGAKGLIRVGASGRMVNSFLQFRGMQNAGNLLGSAINSDKADQNKGIAGESGIAFRMKTDFTKDSDPMLATGGSATTLEIGGAGLNTYGFEFGNLTGLLKANRASFDTGDVYINLTDSKQVTLPPNTVFQNSLFGNGQKLTSVEDYKQDLYTTVASNLTNNRPYSLVTSIRGGEFQAISRRGRFTSSANVAASNLFSNNANNGLDNKWGLALPFYNLNANFAISGVNADASSSYFFDLNGNKTKVADSGTTPRLGFSLGMSTQGKNADGSKTTSIMVIDGAKDYYMGLRNVDMLLKGNGNIGVENGSLNLSLNNMLVVMAAEVAAGYLPGTTYASCLTGAANAGSAACKAQSVSDIKNFSKSDDVLMGMKVRFGGDMNLSLIPNSEILADGTGSRLSVIGDLKLKGSTNTIQISDPINGSALGLDNLTGELGFNNAIVIGKNSSTGDGQVGFNASLQFNPSNSADGVFRARDLNFYPPASTGVNAGSRLGEVALTGGRLTSQFNIIPRN
ncbi:heme utilization protein [Acinetobacter wuhouensis]|uniref:DUF6160 family protein n=1 Tax=Acinetobacter wuhouensis TaxID=1879050 RepID=UPI00083B6F8C|nr:DUF6160 family protein [Acinetobacter wuhouensis]AXQ23280.1 heme utilization protein [Acinetobacter wuhouensis]